MDEASETKTTVEDELKKVNAEKPEVTIKTTQPGPNSKVLTEFKRWKKVLIEMIVRKAALQYYDENNYQFILPPGLVRLVWEVTINERIAAQDSSLDKKERVERAYRSLHNELDKASKQRLVYEQSKEKLEPQPPQGT